MSATDFVVTIHALERMEERFPDIVETRTDEEVGLFIQSEVHDALDSGRYGPTVPIELAPHGVDRWRQRNPGAYGVWDREKTRGYIVVEDQEEGMLVLTVLVGEEREYAMRKLRRLEGH